MAAMMPAGIGNSRTAANAAAASRRARRARPWLADTGGLASAV